MNCRKIILGSFLSIAGVSSFWGMELDIDSLIADVDAIGERAKKLGMFSIKDNSEDLDALFLECNTKMLEISKKADDAIGKSGSTERALETVKKEKEELEKQLHALEDQMSNKVQEFERGGKFKMPLTFKKEGGVDLISSINAWAEQSAKIEEEREKLSDETKKQLEETTEKVEKAEEKIAKLVSALQKVTEINKNIMMKNTELREKNEQLLSLLGKNGIEVSEK